MHCAGVVFSIIFLFGSACLSGITTALFKLGRLRSKEEFKKNSSLFFFQYFLEKLFGSRKWEGLFFSLSFIKHVFYLCYAVLATFVFLQVNWSIFIRGGIIVVIPLTINIAMKFFAMVAPVFALKIFSPIVSIFLTIFSPITTLLMKIFPCESYEASSSSSIRDKILEILYESEFSTNLDPQERKLIISVANFKQRLVREVMVPRINVVCIGEGSTVQESLKIFFKERYSRIPVYQDTIDHIIGVLLYKDVLSLYANNEKSVGIRSLIKPVLYTPETKKISQLLQEFKNKQIHLAIVVDEYGGTEGIVTIEDVLEELVGEIADEDDVEPEVLFSLLPQGDWIIDARMTILDIEKEIGIIIPASLEYDTLGGYVYHRAGAIPSKGWKLHQDNFDLEVLSCEERSIGKVRITPHIAHGSR